MGICVSFVCNYWIYKAWRLRDIPTRSLEFLASERRMYWYVDEKGLLDKMLWISPIWCKTTMRISPPCLFSHAVLYFTTTVPGCTGLLSRLDPTPIFSTFDLSKAKYLTQASLYQPLTRGSFTYITAHLRFTLLTPYLPLTSLQPHLRLASLHLTLRSYVARLTEINCYEERSPL